MDTGRTARWHSFPASRNSAGAVPRRLDEGLYELLITEGIAEALAADDRRLTEAREALRPAEAPDRVALHTSRALERALSMVPEADRVTVGVLVARALLARLDELIAKADAARDSPVEPASVLRALLRRRPDGTADPITQPCTPLLDTALLTNAPGEPRIGSQLATEIPSADRIEVVMAFIRRTGIVPLLGALRRHCEAGRPLSVLTTTYTGSTEQQALDQLAEIGARIKVSYDTSTTRLHAKAWLFHRASGYSTAFIGSSNLTHSAQVTGLEWNVRVSAARNPGVVSKVAAVFESYWEGGDFRPYDPVEFRERSRAQEQRGPAIMLSPVELRAEPFQERLLEQIDLSRRRGHHRNLLVSATGTGKTVMAALDYARLRGTLGRARLLFVAHREEILDQSLATFRHALRDPAFGEAWVGGRRPERFEHVFASIQSLHATGLRDLDPAHFDVVVVDEFHHAAAKTYSRLLKHVAPRELLGLTATPERSDGLDLIHWFEGRIAAELRLWDAIDQHRLTPFLYYGIHDGLDLREVPWKRGRGYDVDGLTRLFTADDAWARRVVQAVATHVDDPSCMRALGFCVSIDHARFMARHFRAAGIPAVAIWADSSTDERRAALRDLADDRVNVVFSVDLFNEGVDLPLVDTLLMLRPTDSPTLFLQQLGRGLRRAYRKTTCVVLDFVGFHRREFRFDRRLRGLISGTRRELERQVEQGFPFLPAGCHLELDPIARDIVLRSIRSAIPSAWTAKVEELRAMRGRAPVSLAAYLMETGLEPEDVYAGNRSWSDLCEAVGLPVALAGPHEAALRRAIGRLLHIDDEERIAVYQSIVTGTTSDVAAGGERGPRLLRMLIASLARQALDKTTSLADGLALLRTHPQVCAELGELLTILDGRVDHVHEPLRDHPDVPLQIHARYTRDEVLAAFGVGDAAKVAPWQSGVYWAEEARADLLAFTLDKTSGNFSPTTRYRDYAISRELIHWESQSTTAEDSETGRRYREHVAMGTAIMLFARLRNDERAFWFLGPATYVNHEGERPMAITWRLTHALPGDLFTSFAAAVA